MNIRRLIGLNIALLCFSLLLTPAEAAQKKLTQTFNSVKIYYGQSRTSFATMTYNITISTPTGVNYGVYKAPVNQGQRPGETIPLVSWSGPQTAPVLTFISNDSYVGNEHCPGIQGKYFMCASLTLQIEVQSDDYGCPWLAGVSVLTQNIMGDMTSWTGPLTRASICPTIPVETYDVSWDPNVVKHDTVLSITPTGGTVNSTLKTYLMENGQLCDKSQTTGTRGGYCRFVGMGTTLSVLGCDNSKVITTAVAHALTDKELHDINVSVNTKNIGTGTVSSVCNFQYILEQL